MVLPYTKIEAMVDPDIDPDEKRWILEDLTPISRRTAMERGEGDRVKSLFGLHPGTGEVVLFSAYFECRHYDPETRTCGNYENRPDVCRHYPWYGEPPNAGRALPEECSYNADVGRPVKLLPTRTAS